MRVKPVTVVQLAFLFSVVGVIGIGTLTYSSRSYQHGTTDRYVGPLECKECHAEESASWDDTRMAKSFEVLKPGQRSEAKELVGLDADADYSDDPSCLPCHTTGYGLVGGFTSIEETPLLAGVGCEACHGPGGIYLTTILGAEPTFSPDEDRKATLIYPPTTRVCRRCHNEDSPFVDVDYVFDVKEQVGKGAHRHFKISRESDS